MQPLGPGEREVWHACKTLGDTVARRIGADLTAAVGLTAAEFAVLSGLDELGGGRVGQQALTDALRWTKARMSHQLTRMAARGLVQREKGATGVLVLLTAQGRDTLARARPLHTAAVREHLLGRLTDEEQDTLVRIAARLADAGP
jgi:DNA-binding MarR family transcriptional regulator